MGTPRKRVRAASLGMEGGSGPAPRGFWAEGGAGGRFCWEVEVQGKGSPHTLSLRAGVSPAGVEVRVVFAAMTGPHGHPQSHTYRQGGHGCNNTSLTTQLHVPPGPGFACCQSVLEMLRRTGRVGLWPARLLGHRGWAS